MAPKKFVWLDGSVNDSPDPDWNADSARANGIIPVAPSVEIASGVKFDILRRDYQFTIELTGQFDPSDSESDR